MSEHKHSDQVSAFIDGELKGEELAAFQEAMEARAALMGGGGLRCPAQRVSDFLEGRLSEEPLPSSSYRRGVVSARLHELYPPAVTSALRVALRRLRLRLRCGGLRPGDLERRRLLHLVRVRARVRARA